jgi:hypothetical protein
MSMMSFLPPSLAPSERMQARWAGSNPVLVSEAPRPTARRR